MKVLFKPVILPFFVTHPNQLTLLDHKVIYLYISSGLPQFPCNFALYSDLQFKEYEREFKRVQKTDDPLVDISLKEYLEKVKNEDVARRQGDILMNDAQQIEAPNIIGNQHSQELE